MRKIFALLALSLLVFIVGCKSYTTFITYFNTYYNADRLMWEAENEFEYQDDKKRIYPRVYVPESDLHSPVEHTSGPPPFLQETIVNKQKRQPVEVKLDSILIKGSKILAKYGKTKYVQGTLYLMAKSYFYKEEWLPAQIKCSELIDFYPDGEYSPDAHLLLSKTLLIQRKLEAGETMLSRTVDIAWQLERFDILSEAFRLEAELALYQNDLEKALRPYRQAIAQTNSSKMRAQWQVDMAALLFRRGEFTKALKEFRKARDHRTDYMGEFESYLYEAACLNRLEKYEEATEILDDLYKDGKYKEWRGYIEGERLHGLRLQEKNENYQISKDQLIAAEQDIDSAWSNNPYVVAYYFDRGLDEYNNDDYLEARNYFSRSRVVKTPVNATSRKLYDLTNLWDIKHREMALNYSKFEEGEELSDSTSYSLAMSVFELGRVHEQLGNQDSAKHYYKISADISNLEDVRSARFYYAYARSVRPNDAYASDSLYQLIVDNHPLTDYGQDAMDRLGFTEAFVIDTAREWYQSGNRLMTYNDYDFAISQFDKVHNQFPESEYAPRSLYAMGWVYEYDLEIADSALHYYRLLLKRYPESEYAKDVKLSVDFLLAVRSGEPIPDSLKTRTIPDPRSGRMSNDKFRQPTKGEDPNDAKNTQQFDPRQMMNHPQNMLKDAKEGIRNQFQKLKDFKLPDDPMELLKKPGDSSSVKPEPVKPPEEEEK